MKKCCGTKSFTKKIKVGNYDIPVVGLDAIMFLVYNLELKNDDEILQALLSKIQEMKNKIPSNTKEEFNSALLNEYKFFTEKFEQNKPINIKVE